MLQQMRSAAKYVWLFIAIAFVGAYLIFDTSGLIGRAPVTATTAVATVNGRDIPYQAWLETTNQLAQQQEQQAGRGLTLDERQRIEQQAFEQLVGEVLLEQEFSSRGIRATDDEIRDAAQFAPPPQLANAPELQTEGRFDPVKYRRYLASPAARASGVLQQLELYYRNEIPRQKLFQQVAGNAFVTDAQLWRTYQDQNDTAVVSYVAWAPSTVPDGEVSVTDAELERWYQQRRKEFERPGRAVVSVVRIPRTITAADSAAARRRVDSLRAEIVSGRRSFEEVARAESADTVSGNQGGDLGRGPRGRFVQPFETAAFALGVNEVSQPVLTQFGWHLIKVTEKKGDTLALRHVLVAIRQSDSSATRTDRRADSLSAIAAGAEVPARFDSAAKVLGLQKEQLVAFENEPLVSGGSYVPSVSAWAFGGAKPGETSDLFDGEDGYYLARLDSLSEGGIPEFEDVKEEVRRRVLRDKKLEKLMTTAADVAKQASQTSLEQAAAARGLNVTQTIPFTRLMLVPGLGQANQAVGAAFGLPVGKVSAPIRTNEGVYVLRVDRRTEADRAAFEAQKAQQRQQVLAALREQRVREFLDNLRRTADIEDHRKDIQRAAARQG